MEVEVWKRQGGEFGGSVQLELTTACTHLCVHTPTGPSGGLLPADVGGGAWAAGGSTSAQDANPPQPAPAATPGSAPVFGGEARCGCGRGMTGGSTCSRQGNSHSRILGSRSKIGCALVWCGVQVKDSGACRPGLSTPCCLGRQRGAHKDRRLCLGGALGARLCLVRPRHMRAGEGQQQVAMKRGRWRCEGRGGSVLLLLGDGPAG